VVVDRPAAEGYIMAQGSMKTLAESLAGIEGLPSPSEGHDLVEPINAAMAYLQSTGRWDKIFTRWFKQPELPDPVAVKSPSPLKTPTLPTTRSTPAVRPKAGTTTRSTSFASA